MFDPLTAFTLERPLLIILSTLYGLALVFYCPPKVKTKQAIKITGLALHILAILIHSFLLFLRFSSTGHAPLTGLYETLLSISWSASFVFLVLSWKRGAFGYGRASASVSWAIIFACLILHVFAYEKVVPRYLPPILHTSPWFELHTAPALLAYGLFTLAFFAALTSLGGKDEVRPVRRSVASFYLWPGMILFTASLGLGGAASRLAWGSWWMWNPKSAFSLLTWGLFFLALVSRGEKRWAKSAFPWLVIAGFAAMIFTYLFTNKGLHDFL
jgi:ABC-type transport system involved in cytochrome c biogenesis permease subunit